MADTFEKEPARATAGIGMVEVRLLDIDGVAANATAVGVAEELDANGVVIRTRRADNVRSLLSASEKTALWNIVTKIRAEAVARLVT
jgi:hypothetical protein